MSAYLHGFVPQEQQRLIDQAGILGSLIYPKVDFAGCTHLLEIGSGVGAQTAILLNLFPGLKITCVDYSEAQLAVSRQNLSQFGNRVTFVCQNVKELELKDRFDAVFICWALEHIPDPMQVLVRMKKFLLPGAKIWVTEVFNSSFYFKPDLPALTKYFHAYNKLQSSMGGDPDVGAKLGYLFHHAGYTGVELFSGGFQLDQRTPEQLEKMVDFWKELMKSGSKAMIEAGVISEKETQEMERDLNQLAKDENAVFFYQFVQAKATN
jgi:SAM-dependent methyltransferase